MTEIYVKVETEASEFDIDTGNIYQVSLKQEAENNRANTELVERMSDILDERVGLIKGHKKRRKKLKVNLEKEEIERKVEEWQRQQ